VICWHQRVAWAFNLKEEGMSRRERVVGYLVRGCVVLVVAVVALCLISGVASLLYDAYRAREAAAAFQSMEAEAKEACAQCFQAGAPVGVRLHREGKVLAVESDTGKANGRLLMALPTEMRATSPEEVRTLVCIGAKERVRYGSYEDGAPAYEVRRQVCACLWPERSTLFLRTVSGGPPPKAKTGRGSASGGDPLPYEITRFIQELLGE
jgi:hypothetical protein